MSRLATVSRLKTHLDLDGLDGARELQKSALEVWRGGSGTATVAVTRTGLVLVDTSTHTLLFTAYTTLTTLIAAIEAIGDWVTILYVDGSTPSSSLVYAEATSCLSYTNRLALDQDQDHYLGILLDKVSNMVELYCYRTFDETAQNEYYDGNGTDLLLLKNWPIDSGATFEIYEDDSDTAIDSDGYDVDYIRGIVWRTGDYVWTLGRLNFRVVYTGGYDPVPDELQDLVCEIASLYFVRRGTDPLFQSIKIGTFRRSYFLQFLGPDIISRLHLWMRLD